jgi:hypothetical protein
VKKPIQRPVNKEMCATCPWRKGSPYEYVRETLMVSALTEASRICHSTGSNAINENTGIPERLCRGARNEQLEMFHAIGFLKEPTDEAWDKQCGRLGIKPNEHVQH